MRWEQPCSHNNCLLRTGTILAVTCFEKKIYLILSMSEISGRFGSIDILEFLFQLYGLDQTLLFTIKGFFVVVDMGFTVLLFGCICLF